MKPFEQFMEDQNLQVDVFNQYSFPEGEKSCICPSCSAGRKPANQGVKCVTVDWERASAKCFHCGDTFQLHTYSKLGGIKKSKADLISSAVIEFFITRGISVETLVAARVGGKAKKIYFNYLKDDKVVRVKYRTTFDKKFYIDEGGESAPYNLDAIDGEKEIIITEGEIDALSFMEAGLTNVISVPNGSNSKGLFRDYHFEFRAVTKVYIAVDNDEAGEKLAAMLSKDFIEKKVVIVKFGDVKDANEYLLKYGAEKLKRVIDPDNMIQYKKGIAVYRSGLTFDFEDCSYLDGMGKKRYYIEDMVATERIAENYVMMDSYGFFFPKLADGTIVFGAPLGYEDFISMVRDAQYKQTGELKRIINSSRIKKISAMDILLHQLKVTKWDGVDRITGTIEAFNLKDDGHGGKDLFRKWFRNALAFSMRVADPALKDKTIWNKMVPMIISLERNWYKTTALRKLGMQGFLSKFFRDSGEDIQIDLFTEWEGNLPDDPRELAVASTQSFIISIDDIDNMLINDRIKGRLRSLISKETVTSRMLYTNKNETRLKTCVYVASSNRVDLLRDQQETRYLPLMLAKPIDKDFFFDLDAFQFWAQVYSEVITSSQEELNFAKTELDCIMQINAGYLYTSGVEDYISDNFKYDPEGILAWDEIVSIMEHTSLRNTRGSELRGGLARLAEAAGGKVKRRKDIQGISNTLWNFRFVGKLENTTTGLENDTDLPF